MSLILPKPLHTIALVFGILRSPTRGLSSSATCSATNNQMDGLHPRAQAVLEYWLTPNFRDWKPTEAPDVSKRWFGGGPEVDAYITATFKEDVEAIATNAFDAWKEQPYEALAGVILMDQFTRNLYRGSAKMLSLDEKARAWSAHILASGHAASYHAALYPVLALPFMHGETLSDQQRCLDILQPKIDDFEAMGEEGAAMAKFLANFHKFGVLHKQVVEKWGRFPHRNALLGRDSTLEEEEGLKNGSIPRF